MKENIDTDILFITAKGTKVGWNPFTRSIIVYLKKAKIDLYVTPHDIRRAIATYLAQNGAPIRMIQALLGHASLAITTKYLRIPAEKIQEEHKATHVSNRRAFHYGRVQE